MLDDGCRRIVGGNPAELGPLAVIEGRCIGGPMLKVMLLERLYDFRIGTGLRAEHYASAVADPSAASAITALDTPVVQQM